MRFIILFIFFLIEFSGQAQEYTYTNYDIKEGLAGSTTYCAAQDKEGFIWFGTETGLSRFDGTNFLNFGIEKGLPDNEVLNIFCDSKNRLWLSMYTAEICYILNGKVYNKHNDTILSKIELKGIAWQVCEDKKGDILIREDKVLHLILKNGQVMELPNFGGNSSSFFSAISQSPDGNFLVLQDDKIYDLNSKGQITFLKKINTNPSVMRLAVLSRDFIMWHSTKYTYTVYSFSKKKEFIFKNPPALINVQILEDSFICINTINGCTIQNFYTHKTDTILPNEPISSVLKDNENNLWFTTLSHGVFRLNSTEFKTRPLIRKNGNPLSVYSIIKYKNNILAGTDGCYLFAVDARNPSNYKRYKFQYPSEVKNRVVSLQLLNDTLFMGTDDNLLKIVSFKKKQMVEFFNVKKLLLLNKDSLLIARKDNLLLFNSHTLKILDTILNQRVISLNFTNQDLYIGTLNGLFIKNFNTKTEIKFNNAALQTRITALEKDINGTLWIGTYGAGVFAYKNGKILYRFDEQNGLTSNICRCIAAYKNNIWVGTDKGINKISLLPKPNIEAKFTNTDGLPSNIINSILQDSDNVFIGTANGITYFNGNRAISNSNCILHITNITSGRDTLNINNEIHLQPNENSIHFEYIAISYNSGGDLKYYYKLHGLKNDTWEFTTSTSANYLSLPSGKYNFEVKAVNKYGVWSKTITIPFEIEKQIWEETWFWILLVLLLSLTIWFIINRRILQIKNKEIEKNNTRKQIAELKQKALKSQITPHFIFNCLNSIQQYIIDNDIEGSNRFISRFSELIRKTLEFSEKQEISIKDELAYLNMYLLLEQERFENKFQFKIEFTSMHEIENSYIPPLILQPLVENAIKHGIRRRDDYKGIVEIKVEFTLASIMLSVMDNGPGIFHAQTLKMDISSYHTSMGMQLVQERIKALNDIGGKKALMIIKEVDEKSYYHGTVINIEIPFS